METFRTIVKDLFFRGVFRSVKVQNEPHLFCIESFAVFQDMLVHSFDKCVATSLSLLTCMEISPTVEIHNT